MCPFIRSLPSPTSLSLKFRNYTTPSVTAALPFKWMAFFLLIKSEWLNLPRGTPRDVHAVLIPDCALCPARRALGESSLPWPALPAPVLPLAAAAAAPATA